MPKGTTDFQVLKSVGREEVGENMQKPLAGTTYKVGKILD